MRLNTMEHLPLTAPASSLPSNENIPPSQLSQMQRRWLFAKVLVHKSSLLCG